MESIRSTGRLIHNEYRKTVEWRSPLTGLYLMVVNSAFWVSVIYCEPRIQEAFLMTSSACIFAWDILFSSSNDRSIITHIVLWPFNSIFRTASVLGSLYSAHLLKSEEAQVACYAAYGTLACLLINPVWEYNEVNQKIKTTCTKAVRKVGNGIDYIFIQPIITIYEYTKYIVLFRWVPPLFGYCKHFVTNFRQACRELVEGVKNWINVAIVERTKRIGNRLKIFLKYWFCAQWWPALKEWMKVNIGSPVRRWADTACYVFVYIFCAHWFPPLWRFTMRQLTSLYAIVHRHVIEPVKLYLIHLFQRFRNWLRIKLHQLAIAIRDSIVWPICLLVVETGKQISIVIYNILLEPILTYLYGRYKIIETSVLIYVLGPVCETVIDHIPEKNPFCDESDVELDGFLPVVEENNDFDENYEEVDHPYQDETGSSARSSPLPEEECEFETGLEFGAINGSESSDEEFDLTAAQRTEKVRRRRRPQRQPADLDQDEEFETLQ